MRKYRVLTAHGSGIFKEVGLATLYFPLCKYIMPFRGDEGELIMADGRYCVETAIWFPFH